MERDGDDPPMTDQRFYDGPLTVKVVPPGVFGSDLGGKPSASQISRVRGRRRQIEQAKRRALQKPKRRYAVGRRAPDKP